MKYISIGSKQQSVSLSEGIFKGLSDDGSLFMPEQIPYLGNDFYASLSGFSLNEIAFSVLRPFVEEEADDATLRQMVEETFSFPIPLVNIHDNINVLELFHGPTQAFKDVGARFLSRLMSRLHPVKDKKMVVLTATSGDTGGAVAHGFYKVPGIEVVVLYPRGKISPYQENQMTSLGYNIHTIAVEGTFDDCQRLVKQAFNDRELRKDVAVTSANSINLGRLLPQMVYYFHGVADIQRRLPGAKPVICVPSGNFGNITAAVMAYRMGLPVKRFIAATNVNDVVPRFLKTGDYNPRDTIVTYANAMDVGDPSNFPRLYYLFENNLEQLRRIFSADIITNKEILETIQSVFQQHNYLLDPHSATGYLGLTRDIKSDEAGFFVSTAHPVKFVEIIEKVLPAEAERLKKEFGADTVLQGDTENMPVSYKLLKDRLMKL
ncbi:MAG: threonine synthase [Anaerophaga sp.]|uniref:threonine synthase n=1 Tax=Anaerophaga thermohalophila TaxID=177400 RepID=UPI000237C069|nr:threonine synthase [Anaerophaga thermohalophila]MDI3521039.1 threonine synthase [Anaerophaga sp.]MDN5290539.1 threonine synthase [Anaerophaga sp.]